MFYQSNIKVTNSELTMPDIWCYDGLLLIWNHCSEKKSSFLKLPWSWCLSCHRKVTNMLYNRTKLIMNISVLSLHPESQLTWQILLKSSSPTYIRFFHIWMQVHRGKYCMWTDNLSVSLWFLSYLRQNFFVECFCISGELIFDYLSNLPSL